MAGGHKTARWRITLGDPREHPVRVAVRVGGGPPGFALSLVQGYYVEPLVAVALARAGYAALPSAGVVAADGALIVMGRSGTGKSSMSVRALARGRGILGDDQVVIGADGGCWPYRRRLRLYPDVEDTAPEAWQRLRPSTRRTLRVRRMIRRASRGFVAPSLAVPVAELRAPVADERVRAARLVIVERSSDVATLTEHDRDAGWAAVAAAEVLADQRARFASAADPRWATALEEAAQHGARGAAGVAAAAADRPGAGSRGVGRAARGERARRAAGPRPLMALAVRLSAPAAQEIDERTFVIVAARG